VPRLAWLLVLCVACGGDDALTGDIAERLSQLEGVTAVEHAELVPQALAGYRFFHLTITQPVDHDDPDGPSFTQRATLLHRDDAAPMVLYGGGYFIADVPTPGRAEPTRILEANQIVVEHRFFGSSRPEPADWSTLTIRQGAGDYHRIVELGKRLYPGSRWIVTGGSKGGETAIFHRRFYPDDVDGTVAYVAPLVLGAPDDRFVPYLAAIGPADCRASLAAFQRQALTGWRTELLNQMVATGFDWNRLGIERALEHAVLELPFALWQYSDVDSCASVTPTTGDAAMAFAFIDVHSQWEMFSDSSLDRFGPYYFQAAVELGFPLIDESAVSDLLMFPMTDVPAVYSPPGVPTPYDADAMADVQDWVRTSGSQLMFVYGTNDPWSAAEFDLGSAQDSYLYRLEAGNHGTNIGKLPEPSQSEAVATVQRWGGLPGPSGKRAAALGRPGEPDLPELRAPLGR